MGGAQINALKLIESLIIEGCDVALYVPGVRGSLESSLDSRCRIYTSWRHVRSLKADCHVLVDPYFYFEFLKLKLCRRKVIFLINAQDLTYRSMMHSNSYFFVNSDVKSKYAIRYNALFRNNVTYRGRFKAITNAKFTLSRRRALFIGRLDEDKLASIHFGLLWIKKHVNSLDQVIFLGDGSRSEQIAKLCDSIFKDEIEVIFEGWVSDPSVYFQNDTFVLGMASSIQLAVHYGQDAVVIGSNGFVSPISIDNFELLDKYHFNIHDNRVLYGLNKYWKSLKKYNVYSIDSTIELFKSYVSDDLTRLHVLRYATLYFYEKSVNFIRSRIPN